MKGIGDVLENLAASDYFARLNSQRRSTLVVDTPSQSDPQCPRCAGRGRVVVTDESRMVRVLRRNQETKLDEAVMVPYSHEVVCPCLLHRQSGPTRPPEDCGLARYPLDRWTLDRFKPAWAGMEHEDWQAIARWAAALPVGAQGTRGWCLRGSKGNGKSHLSVALVDRARQAGVGALLVREVDIVTELQATYHGDDRSEAAVMAKWQRVPVLAIDDVGKAHVPGSADPRTGNAWLASRLYTVLDERLIAGRTTILSTNMDDAMLLRRLGDALVDRLGMLQWVEFTGESRRG